MINRCSFYILIFFFAANIMANEISSQIDAMFKDFNRPDSPGAAVMVIREGKVIYEKGYGLANIEQKIPCATSTNFRLASVSKQFTATSILILAERKQLALDD